MEKVLIQSSQRIFILLFSIEKDILKTISAFKNCYFMPFLKKKKLHKYNSSFTAVFCYLNSIISPSCMPIS